MADQSPEAGKREGAVRRLLNRIAKSDYAMQAEQLQADAESSGAEPVAVCRDREMVCVAGTLRTVTLRPRGGVPALEAELWDGSGAIDLIWLGRREIPGIVPGRSLRATGRVSRFDGRRVIYNPRYELKAVHP